MSSDGRAPRVSVVIAAYQAEATVTAAIGSVLDQTLQDFEVVVVDDGSRDRTAEVAGSLGDPRVRVVRQENGGPSAARNRGVAEARGSLVSMLDSDDLYLPTYLEEMVGLLDRNPEASLAYTDAWVLEEPSDRIRRLSAMAGQRPPADSPPEPADLFRLLVERNVVYTAVTARREAILAVGGYDERLHFAEDYELWLRLSSRGFAARRAPGLLCIHRDHPTSLTTDLGRLVAGRRRVYRILLEEYDLDPEGRRLVTLADAHWEQVEGSLAGTPGPAARLKDVVRRVRRALRPGPYLDDVPAVVAATVARSRETRPGTPR